MSDAPWIRGGVRTSEKHDSAHKHVAGEAIYIDDIPEPEQRSLVHALRRLAQAAGEVPEQAWSNGWDL